ncbi:MAG: DUF2341 domain-containing protein [Ignavibacteria bacterium]|nr:DUF2341 domain-containing protein [Ignavibacteria bacterium]
MKTITALLAFLILSFSVSLYAQYQYETPIYIKNNTANALTNVQVKLVINTQALISAGWMQSDGKDIRFTTTCSGNTFLNHWVENYLNTDTTIIWVNVPSIGASDSAQVFMYYGNAAAPNISTLSVFYGPHSSTDSVMISGAGGVTNSQRGFRFTANEDILLGYFGKREPTGTTRYVTLFDFTTQAILAQLQVSGAAAQWDYAPVTNPIWLKSGQQYILELYQGTNDGYYFGTSSQIGQHLTYGDMRYCNSCTQNTFPTSVLTGYHYGTPDFLYYTKQNVTPAPTFRVLLPADTITPAIPVNLTATPGNAAALLKWKKNTEFDMWQYGVYKNTTNNPGTATFIGAVNHPDTTLTATGLINGTTYYFWVRAADRYCNPRAGGYSTVASCTPTKISQIGNTIPDKYSLLQNYPNPFNPTTSIHFNLPKDTYVELKVYDITGKEIVMLANGTYKAGTYMIDFDAANYSSGVYFYKLTAGKFTDIKRMVLVK